MNELVELNNQPIKNLGQLAPFDYNAIDIVNCKNLELENARELYAHTSIGFAIEYLAQFLNPKFRIQLVDIKLHDLQQGDIPCLPGWHIDGGPDIESEYILCVAGSSLTEFCENKISIPYDKNTKRFCQKLDQAIQNNGTEFAQDWQIIHYNNLTPHRGSPAHKSGKRFLIRLMASNKILPQPLGEWKPLIVRR